MPTQASRAVNAETTRTRQVGDDCAAVRKSRQQKGERNGGGINGGLKLHTPMHVGLASTNGIAASAGPVGRIMAAFK